MKSWHSKPTVTAFFMRSIGHSIREKVTWTKGIDPESGKLLEYDPAKPERHCNAAVTPSSNVCHGNTGGKNWPPTAYNPVLQLRYVPVIESCDRITRENEALHPNLKSQSRPDENLESQ